MVSYPLPFVKLFFRIKGGLSIYFVFRSVFYNANEVVENYKNASFLQLISCTDKQSLEVFLKNLQNSQENICIRVSFLIKLQAASGCNKDTLHG